MFLKADDGRWTAEASRFQLPTEIALLYGGPPCQGYSQIGLRKADDARNSLYLEFVRILKSLKPAAFLIENVPNMLLMDGGRFRGEVLDTLAAAGYANSDVRIVAASDYGVPQHRRRVVFAGIRDQLAFPVPIGIWLDVAMEHERRPVSSVWQAIGDLPEAVTSSGETLPYPSEGESSWIRRELRLDCDGDLYDGEWKKRQAGGPLLHNHHTKEIQERRLKLIGHLKPGHTGSSLPDGMWTGVRPNKWRRLHPEQPAYTILAQMHRDLSEWVHPRYDRWITVREAARLQSFHDGFVFEGSEWQMLKQVGNAVPPLLARALGVAMRHAVEVATGSIDVKVDRTVAEALARQESMPSLAPERHRSPAQAPAYIRTARKPHPLE